MFSEYAATVKNLRGVILFNKIDDKTAKILDWLATRFKYRDIGLPRNRWLELPNKYRDKFIPLEYPLERHYNILGIFVEKCGLDSYLINSLLTASTYIAPLFIIGVDYTTYLNQYILCNIVVSSIIDNKMWKLHFRIADYSILDMYRINISENRTVIKLLREGAYKDIMVILDKRRERINKEIRRYWRIHNPSGPYIFLSYVDNLAILYENVSKGCIDTSQVIEDDSPLFSIIPVIWLYSEIIPLK